MERWCENVRYWRYCGWDIDIVDNRLKGDVRMYDIDVIVDEILIGIWWALHDTGIYVPSRDDNCR